jgi:hypothetical protein
MGSPRRRSFWDKHSLSLIAGSILLLWVVLYANSSEQTHLGSFFGNAIADWTGLVVMLLATKHMYESGSAESKTPRLRRLSPNAKFLRGHSLTIFLLITGTVWVGLFIHMQAMSKWGRWLGTSFPSGLRFLGWYFSPKASASPGRRTVDKRVVTSWHTETSNKGEVWRRPARLTRASSGR